MTRFRIGDQLRTVTLRASSNGLQVDVDGESFSPEVLPIGPGSFVLRHDSGLEPFHCVEDQGTIHLHFRGRVYRLVEERASGAGGRRVVESGLTSPMPGRVIAVKVSPGQRVSRGEEVLIVEAMKMENSVRAPRDGTVRSVAVAVGDMVSPKVALVEID